MVAIGTDRGRIAERFCQHLREDLWKATLDDQKLREAEEWLVDETSSYVSSKLVTVLVRSKLWRETRAQDTLTSWIRNGAVHRSLLSSFFRQLRAHECNELLRCLGREAGKLYPFSSLHMHVCLPSAEHDDAVCGDHLGCCAQFVSAPRSFEQWHLLAKFNPVACFRLFKSFRLYNQNLKEDLATVTNLEWNLPTIETANSVFALLLRNKQLTSSVIAELFNEVKEYLSFVNLYDKWDYSALMERCPSECLAWGRSLDVPCGSHRLGSSSGGVRRYHRHFHFFGFSNRSCVKTLPVPFTASISRKAIKKLSREQVMELSKEDPSFQQYLCMADRQILWEECREKHRSASDEGLLPPCFLTHFPIQLREEEALKALTMQSVLLNDDKVFEYVRLLSFEKATPFLYRRFRNPEYEIRQHVYNAFGTLTAEQKVDATPFLELCHKCINERDPVRGYLYEALQTLDFERFTELQVDLVHDLLSVTANQIDMSYETAEYIEGVLDKFFSRRPQHALKLMGKFATHEQFSLRCPRIVPKSMKHEVLKALDEWVNPKRESDFRHMMDSLITMCSSEQLAYIPKICELYLSPREGVLYVTCIENVVKLLRYWRSKDPSQHDIRLRKIIDREIECLQHEYICDWALKFYSEKAEEFFTKSIRKSWRAYYSTAFILSLPEKYRLLFAKLQRDTILAVMHQGVEYQCPSSVMTLLLRHLTEFIDVNPLIYLQLMEAFRGLDPDKAFPSKYSSADHYKQIPYLIPEALAMVDDPWKGVQVVLDQMMQDPDHPCRLALPHLLSRLPPNKQGAILNMYRACPARESPPVPEADGAEFETKSKDADAQGGLEDKALGTGWYTTYGRGLRSLQGLDEYLLLLAQCCPSIEEVRQKVAELNAKSSPLTPQEYKFLARMAPDTPEFWNIVLTTFSRVPTAHDDFSLVRKALEVAPRHVRLAGKATEVQSWLRGMGQEPSVHYKILQAMLKLVIKGNTTLLNPEWFFHELPRLYGTMQKWIADETELMDEASEMMAQDPGQVSSEVLETSKFICKQHRSLRIKGLHNRLLTAFCEMAKRYKDHGVCLGIVKQRSDEDLEELCAVFKQGQLPPDVNDDLFHAWFDHVRSSMKDSLRVQAILLCAIKSSTRLYQIIKSKAYDITSGAFFWLYQYSCDTVELAKLLSNDSEPSHRFLAYKILSDHCHKTEPKIKELLKGLEMSFQYQFV